MESLENVGRGAAHAGHVLMYALSERLPVLTLAGSVVERMRMLLERGKTPVAGIRLGVANAGCSGISYKTGYADGVRYGDKTIEEKGVKVFIDTGSGMFFFLGARMDCQEGEISSGFAFENPNRVDACGGGEFGRVAYGVGKLGDAGQNGVLRWRFYLETVKFFQIFKYIVKHYKNLMFSLRCIMIFGEESEAFGIPALLR